MAKVNINFDGDAAKARFAKAAKQAVHAVAISTQNEITSQLNRGSSNRGKTPSTPGQPPHRDTGALANSFQLDISQLAEANPKARVASNLPYARIHEYGGRIKGPVAVPIGAEGRKASLQAGGNLRSLDLTFIPRKGKPPLLVRTKQRRGKDVALEPLFVILQSVTMPARPYVRPAVVNVNERGAEIALPFFREAASNIQQGNTQ